MGIVDPKALILCIVFPVFAIAAVVARFWAGYIRKSEFFADDWLILPALACSIGNAISVLYGAVKADLGRHNVLEEVGYQYLQPKLVALGKMVYASEPMVTVSITFARLSILLFYGRIFSTPSFRKALIPLHILNIIWGVAFTFAYLFQCNPIHRVWTNRGGDRTGCIGTQVHYWYSIATIVLDVLVLAMPWREVLKLKMDWRKKVVVLAMFGLGAIVTAVSIGKCYTFFTVGDRLRKYHDFTYDNAPLFYWTVPECCLAVVCACLPTLRPIFRLISTTPLRGLLSLSTFRSSSGKHGDASKAYVLSTHEGKDRHSTAGFKRISANSALIGRGRDVETDDLESGSFVSPV